LQLRKVLSEPLRGFRSCDPATTQPTALAARGCCSDATSHRVIQGSPPRSSDSTAVSRPVMTDAQCRRDERYDPSVPRELPTRTTRKMAAARRRDSDTRPSHALGPTTPSSGSTMHLGDALNYRCAGAGDERASPCVICRSRVGLRRCKTAAFSPVFMKRRSVYLFVCGPDDFVILPG